MKLSRRSFSAMALSGAAAIALSACGRSTTPEQGASKAVALDGSPATGQLTVWVMGVEGETLPGFVQDFKKQNPGVDVAVTAVPWEAAYNKFQTAIAGGTTPDVAMLGSTWMADFGDALATVPDQIEMKDFFPGSLSAARIGDRVAGVPWYVETRVLHYRTDIAKQAGWDKAPATWDELKKMASDMQKVPGVKWGLRLPVGADSFQSALWMPWSAGAEVTDGKSWTLDTPEMKKGFDYYRSFFADGIADPSASTAAGAVEAEFVAGTTPMSIEGPYLRGQLAKLGGKDFEKKYTTAVLPTDKASIALSGGSNLVVFSKSRNVESAWKLVKWLSQPETQGSFFARAGDLPASVSAWKNPAFANDPSLTTFRKQLDTAKAPPVSTRWTRVVSEGDKVLEQIRRGTVSVTDGLSKLQSQASSIGMG
ncbi:extracellular solute-binding protein [Arthrobacter sp. RAF14]|uniref:extracellular solute-binding protein n=1 Tax=Arthrobacter sp. RAF14 TaxID=3233051 RepID=UPI003F93CE48